MTGYTSQKLYFQLDNMNNHKLQKSQQFIPTPQLMLTLMRYGVNGQECGMF